MGKKTNLLVGAVSTIAATAILSGCNLYGKDEYKVIFETNGGEAIPSVTTGWGKEVTMPNNPIKKGHTFAGWYYDIDLLNKVEDNIIVEGDITLYAKWDINQYSVTFNSNGGSEVASVRQDFDTDIVITNPTREGYTFVGWYLDQEYTESFSLKVPEKDITVYARWEANSVEITFDANGTNVNGSMGKPTYRTDGSLLLEENKFTREGYIFKGWSTRPTGDVEFLDKGSVLSLTSKTQSVTLYAVWEAEEFEIRFIHNNTTMSSIKAGYETTIALPTKIPTKEGYSFANWGYYTVTSDATFQENKVYYTVSGNHYSQANVVVGETISANTYYELVEFTSLKMPLGGIDLFPIWNVNEYSISFDSMGGSDVNTITQNFGTSLVLPEPTKEGYNFLGWYVKDSNVLFNPTVMGQQMNTSSIEVYAKFSANTYRLDFNSNGGTGVSYQEFVYGVSASLKKNTFTKVGYSFLGWSTSPTGEVVYQDEGNYSIGSSNATLYAIWKANENTKYVINHYTNGLIGSPTLYQKQELTGTSDSTISIEYLDITGFVQPEAKEITIAADGSTVVNVYYERETYKVIFTATNPETLEEMASKEIEVKFEGNIVFPSEFNIKNYAIVWMNGSEIVTDTTKVEGNITLVAKYEKIEKSIVLHSDGSQDRTFTADAGSKIIDALKELNLTREGYSFGGYYLDEECLLPLTDTEIMPENNNVNVYVKWDINTYSITFISDGGSETETITKEFNEAFIVPANPTKLGNTFAGWVLIEGEEETPYSFTANPVMGAKNLVLKATWTANKYTLTLDANGGSGTTTQVFTYGVADNLLSSVGFTKEGYHFKGWATSAGSSTPVYSNTQEFTIGAEDTTLYAVWKIDEYDYKFIIEGLDSSVLGDEDPNKDYSYKLTYGLEVEVPEIKNYKDLNSIYIFDGWYSDPECTIKVNVDQKASGNKNYYGKYISSKYNIIYQNDYAGETIYSTPSNGKEISLMDFINKEYESYLVYDYVYGAVESAIKAQALGDSHASYASLMSDYVVVAVYFGAKLQNSNNFNSVPVEYKVQIVTQGVIGKMGINLDIANALGIPTKAEQAVNALEKLDLSNVENQSYALLVTQFQSNSDKVTQLTSEYRKQHFDLFNKYKQNAYNPSKEGYYFDGWNEYVDESSSDVYRYAKWISKVSVPLDVRVQSTNKKSVTYAWNSVNGVSIYEVKYTIFDKNNNPIKSEVIERTNLLEFTISSLEDGYKVSFQVKSINPVKENTVAYSVLGPDGELIEVKSVNVNSEYSEKLTYEYSSSAVELDSEEELTKANYYYYSKDSKVFVFFESKYYTFSGIEHIEILDNLDAAEYLVLTDDENRLSILGSGTKNNEFSFRTYVKNTESIDESKTYYGYINSSYQEVNPNTHKGDLFIGNEYKAIIKSLVNGIEYGDSLNSYLNTKKNINSLDYINKEVNPYLIGTTVEPNTNIEVKKEDGAFALPENKGTTDYYYNVLVGNTVEAGEVTKQIYKQYENGFKFDFEVVGNGGAVLSTSDFQLDYKFFDKDGNEVDLSTICYEFDDENDVFFFKPVEGSYKVVVSPKLDGHYLTTDKVINPNKTYYEYRNGEYVKVVTPTEVNLASYYENFNNIALPHTVVESISQDISNGNSDGNPIAKKYSKEFEFTLVDGVNAFTLEGMKRAFSNVDTNKLIVHNNMKLKLHPNQVAYYEHVNFTKKTTYGQLKLKEDYPVTFTQEDGYGDKIWSKENPGNNAYSIKGIDGYTYYYVGNGKNNYAIKDADWYYDFDKEATKGSFILINEWLGNAPTDTNYKTASIFTRGDRGIVDGRVVGANDLVLEGNYFVLDGSSLPYVTSKLSVATVIGGQQESLYHIQDGATAIFELRSYADCQFKNLEIIGNSGNSTSAVSKDQKIPVRDYMEITSGGYQGIRAATADLENQYTRHAYQSITVDNVVLKDLYIGINASNNLDATIKNTYINNSWANSIYSHGPSNINISTSYLGDNGGGSIHIEDGYEGDGYENPNVTLDLGTIEINNYISGEEPWFKSHAMEVIALGMKAQIDRDLGGKFTCLKSIKDPVTGLSSEKLNLVYLGRHAQDSLSTGYPETINFSMTSVQQVPGYPIYTNGTHYYLYFTNKVASEIFDIIVEIYPLG